MAHYLVQSNLAEPSSEASDNTAVGADSAAESKEAPAVDQPKELEVAKEPSAEHATRTTALLSGNKGGGIDAVLPKRRASRAVPKQQTKVETAVRRSTRAAVKA